MRGHDITCGPVRCVKDHRTRQEKMEDVLKPGSGATEGEKANARSLMATMKPVQPKHVSQRDGYQPPAHEEAQPAGRTGFTFEGEHSFSFDGTFDVNFNWSDLFKAASQRRAEFFREELRKAQAKETLRREGFVMPEDPGFESEFTNRAFDANATFRRASQQYNDVRDMLSKMSTEELFEVLRQTGGTRGPSEPEPR